MRNPHSRKPLEAMLVARNAQMSATTKAYLHEVQIRPQAPPEIGNVVSARHHQMVEEVPAIHPQRQRQQDRARRGGRAQPDRKSLSGSQQKLDGDCGGKRDQALFGEQTDRKHDGRNAQPARRFGVAHEAVQSPQGLTQHPTGVDRSCPLVPRRRQASRSASRGPSTPRSARTD